MKNLDEVEEQLGRAIPETSRTLLENALTEKHKLVAERLKAALPEGSEPCVMFHATPVATRTR